MSLSPRSVLSTAPSILLVSSLSMLAALSAPALAANRAETDVQVPGAGPAAGEGGCGDVVLLNSDGTYESGYAWQYGGVVAPDFGAFAEQYDLAYQPICGILLDLTTTSSIASTMDAYIWDSYQGLPGLVIWSQAGIDPGTIAFWPSVSRHVIDVNEDACPTGEVWAGFWGNWPGAASGFYVGADLDGFGGSPYTNIAPGIGYPTGWNNVSVVWGPTGALGIGIEYDSGSFCDIFPAACCLPDGRCYMTSDPYDCRIQEGEFLFDSECDPDPCSPTPTQRSSWGAIKRLYTN